MNKEELVDVVVGSSKVSKKDVQSVINSTIAAIQSELSQGGSVLLSGFGKFTVANRNARVGRNPQTGDSINIEAKKVPVFKPGKDFKKAV